MVVIAPPVADVGLYEFSLDDIRKFGKSHQLQHLIAGRDGWSCAYCGIPLKCSCLVNVSDPWLDSSPFATVDHRLAQSAGGTDDLDNLVLACQPCNSSKCARPIESAKVYHAPNDTDIRHRAWEYLDHAFAYMAPPEWSRDASNFNKHLVLVQRILEGRAFPASIPDPDIYYRAEGSDE